MEGKMNIDESSTGKLLEFVQYDYRQFAFAVVLVELSEGPEVANRLLDGLPTA
jgi:hypothetical protein